MRGFIPEWTEIQVIDIECCEGFCSRLKHAPTEDFNLAADMNHVLIK